ncbi:HEPN/Toprim-associated domain-containing protein, partial [Pseudomonas putida]
NLLGFTEAAARNEYNLLVQDDLEMRGEDYTDEGRANYLSFEEYCEFACQHALATLDDTYIEHGTDGRYLLAKGRFEKCDEIISRIPNSLYDSMYWSEQSYFRSAVCILHPYSMLQVFFKNPLNADAEVIWQYGPIVEAGWVKLEEFQPIIPRQHTILVATEGSSDARILKHALDLLCSDVSDFFRFVDLEGAHPFWGTGNLVKFAEGLLRIDVHNNIIFVLDNDAEGLDAHQRLGKLSLPPNMRAMMLPDLPQFDNFPARGPEGVHNCNINGRAVAIECYLDLNMQNYPPAHIQWSNYKKEIERWQGALEHKESYMRRFLGLSKSCINKYSYDTSKIKAVLEALISEAIILNSIQN